MIAYLDKIYTATANERDFLKKYKIYSILRWLIRNISNVVIPIYFFLTRDDKKYSLINSSVDERVVVSLTTFPARINKIWMVIETLMRQTYKPDIIVLWLSKEQFDSIELLPQRLLRMRNRGLRIVLCDGDLRSHKKYFYAFNEYRNDIIITADDDVFYIPTIIEKLIYLHKEYPYEVCCNLSRKITFSEDNKLLPYKYWPYNQDIINAPCHDLLPIGMGGVLYPANYKVEDMMDPSIFMMECRNADDLWLKAMGYVKNIKVVSTGYYSLFLPIINYNNITLASNNIEHDNDVQLSNIQLFCQDRLGVECFKSDNI